jgi:CRISPR-associated protein Cas6
MIVELVFPVSGTELWVDHAYPLFAALSHMVPEFHDPSFGLRFAPITGMHAGEGKLQLGASSYLRVRLADDQIKIALPLAGKSLRIADHQVRLGVPRVQTLIPAPTLISHLTTFKNATTPEQFLTTARAKLAELNIQGDPQLPLHLTGNHAGEPRRKVLRIHDVSIIGYTLIISELTAEHSLTLQTEGLGGRTQMGCGFFQPFKEGK